MAGRTVSYFAQNVDIDCDFYVFSTEAKRDKFARKYESTGWKCGRVVYEDGYEREVTDFYYGG
jgi:hypothetical protein